MDRSDNRLADKFDNLSTGAKGVLLVIGAYFVSIGVTACIITLAIMSLLMLNGGDCTVVGHIILIQLIVIAVVFLVSIVVVRTVAWKIIPSVAGRYVVLGVYVLFILASYAFIAFGIMVIFNC